MRGCCKVPELIQKSLKKFEWVYIVDSLYISDICKSYQQPFWKLEETE